MDGNATERRAAAAGSSLVGILMIVVALGALTATAILGVSALTGGSDKVSQIITTTSRGGSGGNGEGSGGGGDGGGNQGGSSGSSCRASADAARAASAVYFANSGGRYPVKWSDLTTSNPPSYEPATNVVIDPADPKELDGNGWKLVVSGGGASEPIFTCKAVIRH